MDASAEDDLHEDSPGWDANSTFQLLERVKAGERGASDELFARYLPSLERWAHGRLPGWARDVAETSDFVQDTVLEAFKRLERFEYRGEGALRAYLRQVLLNRIRREFRRAAQRPAPTPLDSQGKTPARRRSRRRLAARPPSGMKRRWPGSSRATGKRSSAASSWG